MFNQILDTLPVVCVVLLPISAISLSIWFINALYDFGQISKKAYPVSMALATCGLMLAMLFASLVFFLIFRLGTSEIIATEVITTVATATFASWGVLISGCGIVLISRMKSYENRQTKQDEEWTCE